MLSDFKTRRLSLFEVFIWALRVFRNKFVAIVAVTAFVYLPMYAILALLPEQYDLSFAFLSGRSANDADALTSLYINAGTIILFEPLAIASYAIICRATIEDEESRLPAILDQAIHKWVKLSLTYFLYLTLIICSAPLIILPIYFAVSYVFCSHIVAVSDMWGFRAFAESRRLIKGRFFFTAAFFLFMTILTLAIGIGLSALLAGLMNNILAMIIFRTATGILTAYFSIVTTIYFLNLFYLNKGR